MGLQELANGSAAVQRTVRSTYCHTPAIGHVFKAWSSVADPDPTFILPLRKIGPDILGINSFDFMIFILNVYSFFDG